MGKYQAILYDLDGTILNTLEMNMYPLLRIIKEETGADWTFEEVLKFASYPGMKVMEELGFTDKEKTYARWVEYVNAYEGGAAVYSGFEEVLEEFQKQGIIQAVVSAKTTEQYEIDMVTKGLDRYMAAVVLVEDTKKHKPDSAPLLKCLEQLKLEPNEAIYIGDSLADYQAAKNAPMDFGYAKWGSVSEKGIEKPVYTFEKPTDLLKLL